MEDLPWRQPWFKERNLMKTSKIIRALPVLPVAWVSSKIYEKKSQLEAQVRLEKWSRFILKYLGYDLSVKGIETIPKEETIFLYPIIKVHWIQLLSWQVVRFIWLLSQKKRMKPCLFLADGLEI